MTDERTLDRDDADVFYERIPQHVLDQRRYGSELGREIAGAEGRVVYTRQKLRRAVKSLRRLRTEAWPADVVGRVSQGYLYAHADYRAAQAELRGLLDQRWARKQTAFRNAAE